MKFEQRPLSHPARLFLRELAGLATEVFPSRFERVVVFSDRLTESQFRQISRDGSTNGARIACAVGA